MAKEKKMVKFEELVSLATQDIHSALLEGGSKEMKNSIFKWMDMAIRWSRENSKIDNRRGRQR